jgi:hypothetical protein
MERLRIITIAVLMVFFAFGFILPQTTLAITVAGSDPNAALYQPSSFFDGVVYIHTDTPAGGFYGSGALINTTDPNHAYILTAAHVLTNEANFNVTSWRVTFKPQGSPPITYYSTDPGAASFWPNGPNGWNGVYSNGADIGLIRLGSPVTGIAGYNLLSNDSFIFGTPGQWGTVATIAGYGISGTGSTGTQVPPYLTGTLRVGENNFDIEWLGKPNNPNEAFPGSPYGFDFDNGLSGNPGPNDVFGNLYGTPNYGFPFWDPKFIDGGLGLNEVLTAQGDSGGPSFVTDPNTQNLVIAGVHSFGYTFLPYFDVDNVSGHEPNSSFGETAGDTRVVAYLDWIDGVVTSGGGGEVPEPCTMILLGSGLLGLLGLRKKFKS